MHLSRSMVVGLSVGLVSLSGCSKARQLMGGQPSASASGAPAGSLPTFENFEGEIGLQITPGPNEHAQKPVPPLTLLVKNGKLRTDMPAGLDESNTFGKAYVILDPSAKKLLTVLDDRKEVVEIELDKLGQEMNGFGHGMAPPAATGAVNQPHTPAEPPPKVTKTGHKDVVAGYACEDWDIASADGSKGRVCVGDQGASWFKLPTLGVPSKYAWAAELFDGKHFPLRAIGYEKDGTESGRVEVTRLERKPIAAQIFEAPAGYRTVNFQQAMQEIMAAAMAKQGMPMGFAGAGMPSGMPMMMPSGMPRMRPPGVSPLHQMGATAPMHAAAPGTKTTAPAGAKHK